MFQLEELVKEPSVMAIVNCTPDSFYSESRVDVNSILEKCKHHVQNGAKILDVGAYSTRPGADVISVEEELSRLIPVIQLLRKEFPEVCFSVDTFRQKVAEQAVAAGATIVNDISGGEFDPDMLPYVAKHQIPYVLMHLKGTHETMHQVYEYKDLVKEIIQDITPKLEFLKQNNVPVLFDPGFGFSKNIEQNYELMRRLDEFQVLDCPILVGISRKSMIFKVLENTPDEALNGTSVLNTIALSKGAKILRVHDSKEAMECVKLTQKLNN
jgi:dihydropteroate synthase